MGNGWWFLGGTDLRTEEPKKMTVIDPFRRVRALPPCSTKPRLLFQIIPTLTPPAPLRICPTSTRSLKPLRSLRGISNFKVRLVFQIILRAFFTLMLSKTREKPPLTPLSQFLVANQDKKSPLSLWNRVNLQQPKLMTFPLIALPTLPHLPNPNRLTPNS